MRISHLAICIVLLLSTITKSEEKKNEIEIEKVAIKKEFKKTKLEVFGGLDIQAQKAIYDNDKNDNFDQLFGRIKFGSTLSSDRFQGKLYIGAYPAGFGYEPLFGVSLDSTDSMTTEAENIPKFQVWEGFIASKGKILNTKLGRFFIGNTKGINLGNYLDDGINGGFLSRCPNVNALELNKKFSLSKTSFLLGVGDKNLNKGFLRFFETISLMEDKLNIGAGYRSNVFDLVYDDEATVISNVDIQADFSPIKNMLLFLEIGVVGIQKDVDPSVPVLFGFEVPTGPVLDILHLEFQFLDQKIRGGGANWNVYMKKKFAEHYSITYGIFSDGKLENVTMGLRVSADL